MDFLNKAWAQLTDLFRSMTPGARITAGLLLVVVVTSLGYLFKYQSSGPSVYLMGGEHFAPSDIDAMLAAFAKANLESYEVEGTRIRVPRGQQSKYIAALADGNALPANFFTAIDKAIESGSPFESKDQREQRIKAGKQKQLSQVVGSMQGIENAVVLYDSDFKSGLKKEKIITASVSVKPRGSEQLKESQVMSIRRLVASAIAGLDPERVGVSDLNSGRTYAGSPEGMGQAFDDPYGARKRMYEQDWTAKILNALSPIQGVSVAVNVELDKGQEYREEEIKHEKQAVPYQTSEKTSSKKMEGSTPAGKVGFAANTPTSLANQRTKGTSDEEEQSEQTTLNAIPGKRTEKRQAGLTPQRVTVAVGIPASYFKNIWLARNRPEPGAQPKTPDQKDLDQIRTQVLADTTKNVAMLLPKPEGTADAADLVRVGEFQDITPPALPEPGVKENALAWFGQYWSTLGLIGLAFFSLLMLRSMVRAAPSAPTAAASLVSAASSSGTSSSSAPEAEESQSGESPPHARLKRFRGTGMSLRDELSQLVTEDPDAAANILRAWIGNAS